MINKIYMKFFSLFKLFLIIFVMNSCPSPGNNNMEGFFSSLERLNLIDKKLTRKQVEELILESKKIDTSDIYAVAQKFISILKQAQKSGSCTLFSPHGLLLADPNITPTPTKFQPYYTVIGKSKGEFIMQWLDHNDVQKVNENDFFGKINENHKIVLKYKNFSIDGKYSINGSLKLIQNSSDSIIYTNVIQGSIESPNNVWKTTGVPENERTFVMKGPVLPKEGVSMIFPASTNSLFNFRFTHSCGKVNDLMLPGLTNEYNSIVINNGGTQLKLYPTSKDVKIKSLLEFLFSQI